jgi:hypothetical protein
VRSDLIYTIGSIPNLSEVVAEVEEESSTIVMAADACVEKGRKRSLDVTPFFNTLQTDAAAQLGIPVSSLSKRWKKASNGRKWPHRHVLKIDVQIKELLSTVSDEDVDAGKMSIDVESRITALLHKRAACLQPVSILM